KDKRIILCYPRVLQGSYETIILEDNKMKKDWKSDKMYRLQFKIVATGKESFKFTIERDLK
ncbi:MAG: hypothetical protein RR490_07555, partial [Niameybacter sp.]